MSLVNRCIVIAPGGSVDVVDRKVAWSAAILRRAQADVFGFQELLHRDTLARVIDQAGMTTSYSMLAPEGQRGQGTVCAAAVRKDILDGESGWITDFPPAFRLQSKGEDKQTAAMFVDISTFSHQFCIFASNLDEIRNRSTSMYVIFSQRGQPKLPMTSGIEVTENSINRILGPSAQHCRPSVARPKRWHSG